MFKWLWYCLRLFRERIQDVDTTDHKKFDVNVTDASVQTNKLPTSRSTKMQLILTAIKDHHKEMERKYEVIATMQQESIQNRNEVIAGVVSKFNHFVQVLHESKFGKDIDKVNEQKEDEFETVNNFCQSILHFKDKDFLTMFATVFSINFPTFDGTASFTKYKKQFDQLIQTAYEQQSKWSDGHTVLALITSLRQPATGNKTLNILFNALESHYGDKYEKYAKEFKIRKQEPNEDVEEWGKEIVKLGHLAFASPKSFGAQQQIIRAFRNGLRDERIKRGLKLFNNLNRLEDNLKFAAQLEKTHQEYDAAVAHEETNGAIVRTICHHCGQLGYIKGRMGRLGLKQHIKDAPDA